MIMNMRTNNILKSLDFEKSPVRAILQKDETVVWLCLNDLLKVLDRVCMMDNGQAMRICKTSRRVPFKEGGRNRWGVKPYDVHNLLRAIRPENGMVAKVCDRMQEWINGLPVGMEPNVPVVASTITPAKEPVIFNYQDRFPITFKTNGGKTMINATQMARSFGKLPAEWLRLAATQEFRESLVQRGEFLSLEGQIMTTRGNTGATWIEESLAMEFARWLSPDFSVWCNNRIQELVTKGYAAMPNHREHCSSFSEAVSNYPIPQNFEEALMLAAHQAKKIREDEPKVAFYKEYVEDRDCFKSGRIAEELQITTVQLHRFLAENNIVKFEKRQWVVSTPYQALQCDVPYMWEKKNGKVYPTGSVKRWTPAGREYILELWRSKHSEEL